MDGPLEYLDIQHDFSWKDISKVDYGKTGRKLMKERSWKIRVGFNDGFEIDQYGINLT